MPVTVHSFAKINLGLYIGAPGMREDGFHELRTVYQTIALHDTLRIDIKRNMTGIEVKCRDPRVPEDESNICHKVAERVMKAMKLRGRVVINIEKKLPVQGGLGAASGNAVATLIGLERAVKQTLSAADRLRICEEVGSDVPLFLLGGTVLGLGRGEQVYPLPELPEMDIVMATPEIGVSTPKAFQAWDELFTGSGMTKSGQLDTLNTFSHKVFEWLNRYCSSPKVTGVSAKGGNRAEPLLLDLVRTGIENDFERVVFPQFPELRDVKRAMEHAGAKYASLSGSGSAVYGLFAGKAAAVKAAATLKAKGIPAVATVTLPRAKYWKQM
ncbi:MAG TPA: 4-(cytidine 5'-diphospho)-2-C-methyl-D-erythritol kinase [Terriglobales bacterium]|nr:4-(cytidine 5'-diphospho)-2-C-methyl-D-erythritol kinase [Terriglobales bacterium]